MEQNTKLLETILATQVLILERLIVLEKQGRGAKGTGEYVRDAVSMIDRNQENIVSSLSGHLRQ